MKLQGRPSSLDYLNANHIVFQDSPEHRRYILAQGPMATTVDDFWCVGWGGRRAEGAALVSVAPTPALQHRDAFLGWP